MSEKSRSAQCQCADKKYSESVGDDSDDALDAHESTERKKAKKAKKEKRKKKMQKVDTQESLIDSSKSTFSLKYATSEDSSEIPSAVDILKRADADRKSRISVQNLKLSLIFPKASSCLLI